MFQNQNSLFLPFTNDGIDISSENNPKTAKYIENILLGNSNTGEIRFGTYLHGNFVDNPDRIYRDIIHGNSYLKIDGTSENIAYVKYLTTLPHIRKVEDVRVIANVINPNITDVNIDISHLNADQKAYLKKILYNDVVLYLSQVVLPVTATIYNLASDNNNITFNLNLDLASYNFTADMLPLNDFTFWVERAGIYREVNNVFEAAPLKDDLDSNVIVTSINYKNNLVIVNGIDPVFIYDGNAITELLANASIVINDNPVINDRVITFTIFTNIKAEYQQYLTNNAWLKLINNETEQENAITNIAFNDIADNKTTVAITCRDIPLHDIRNILYKKNLPKFSYIAIGNDRLWALPESRDYFNKFRPQALAQKIYYSAKPKSVFDWFNEKTAQIDFIDISINNDIPENIEIIKCFQGEMFFIGRHTTQLWNNGDPTYSFDGEGDDFGGFKFQRLFKVGVMQKSLCQEMPNNLAIISTFGKSFSFYRNRYGQIEINQNFIDPVKDYLKNQFAFIKTDIDYREMTSFFYPYNDLLGIKIKNECLIYQIKNREKGFWTTFSGNFSDAKCYFYNEIDKNLYLGMNSGNLLTYADKAGKQVFTDLDTTNMNNKKLLWRITYNDLWLQNTWNNDQINISAISLNPLIINVKIFINDSQTEPIYDEINVDQKGSLFDIHGFGKAVYALQHIEYPYESIKFSAESFVLEFEGFVDNYFLFEKIILTGGVDNAD